MNPVNREQENHTICEEQLYALGPDSPRPDPPITEAHVEEALPLPGFLSVLDKQNPTPAHWTDRVNKDINLLSR